MRSIALLSIFLLATGGDASAGTAGAQGQKWVASWTTAIAGAFARIQFPPGVSASLLAEFRQPEMDFALPDGEAVDQSLRMIIKPDLWGDTVRVRFSNVFGDRDLSLGAAALGLQESGGRLVPGTNVRMTFDGKSAVTIPKGGQVTSDPLHLKFVTTASKRWLQGRNLAVSFAVQGRSGPLSAHRVPVISYISARNSGDRTNDNDDGNYPYVTRSLFLVNELDVMADSDTVVVCALGDSITDGGTTINGFDGWSDVLAARLHKVHGEKVSVVNMGIGGNTVVNTLDDAPASLRSQPVVQRLDRDVLGIAGLKSVVWLEGINDLGSGQSQVEPVIEGYKQVVARLHARGITVVGATVTSSLWPEPNYESSPMGAELGAAYGSRQTNDRRMRLNEFIRASGIFDGVADMARATENPITGALYKEFQSGDYLHPNRAGHLVMAGAIDFRELAPPMNRRVSAD